MIIQNLHETMALYIGLLAATILLIIYEKINNTTAALITFILTSITILNYLKIFIYNKKEKKE
ncbi:MAG: hypothetical protein N3F64_00590 [Nitrososphaeria archaeon]|nr:hypothetical protein [Nitrososphaeria archaeon]